MRTSEWLRKSDTSSAVLAFSSAAVCEPAEGETTTPGKGSTHSVIRAARQTVKVQGIVVSIKRDRVSVELSKPSRADLSPPLLK
jgi:hypothetical protein